MKADRIEMLYKAQAKLTYDPVTGVFKWIKPIRKEIAGYKHADGYVYIKVDHRSIEAHRLAWFMHYGEIPNMIDHINMDRSDNRIANLRNSSVAENNRNKRKQSNNTSGYKGVSLYKPNGKYTARIMLNGKTHYLGYFDDAESASLAYQQAAKELHGEYARS